MGFSVLLFWLFFRSVFRFLLQKTSVFRFWRSLRSADFSFFSIWFSVFVKNTSGFSVLVPDVVFGFFYFVLFWVPVSVRFEQHLISNSRETPKLFRGMRISRASNARKKQLWIVLRFFTRREKAARIFERKTSLDVK